MEGLGKLGINLQGLVFYLVNFGLIAFILAKFVYKPVLKFLDDRKQSVADSLRAAENLRTQYAQEVSAKEQEKASALATLQTELESIRKSSEEKAKKIIQEAEEERRRIIAQTEQQVQQIQNELEENAEEDLLKRILDIVDMAVKQKVSGPEAKRVIQNIWREKQQARRKAGENSL